MPNDPIQVDAGYQVRNLPSPGGSGGLWSQQLATLSQLTEYQDLAVDLTGNLPVNLILNSPNVGFGAGFAVVGGLNVGSFSGTNVPVVRITNWGDGVIALPFEDLRSAAGNRFNWGTRSHSIIYGNDLGIWNPAPSFQVVGTAQWKYAAQNLELNPGMILVNTVTNPCTIVTNVEWNVGGWTDIDTNVAATAGSGSYATRIMPSVILYPGQDAMCVYDYTRARWWVSIDASVVRYVRSLPTFFPTPKAGDILVFNGTGWEVLPIGTSGQSLTPDSTTRLGLKWA